MMGTNTLLEAVVLLNETRRLAASILAASCSLFEPDPPKKMPKIAIYFKRNSQKNREKKYSKDLVFSP